MQKQPILKELLKAQADFKNERSLLHALVEDEFGCILLLVPKFHPEFNAIEYVWANEKSWTRQHCDYNIGGLRKAVRVARARVTSKTLKNCFYHARQWAYTYLTEPDGLTAQKRVKEYSSHRRVSKKDPSHNLAHF